MAENPRPFARGALATAWESEPSLRQRVQETAAPYMARWIRQEAVGVPSVKATCLNVVALEAMARVWCPAMAYPKTIPIGIMREEAGL